MVESGSTLRGMAPASDLHPPMRCPVCLAGFWSGKAVCRGKRRTFTGYQPPHESVGVVAAHMVSRRLAEFGISAPTPPQQGRTRRLGPGGRGRPAPPPPR